MNKLLVAVSLAMSLLGAPAAADQIPAVLKAPLSQGLKVHRSFEGPSGMTGWLLLKDRSEPLVVFTTPDGKTLFAGAVLDASGRNLVEGYVEKYAPKADFSSYVERLQAAPYVLQGDANGKHLVYAFFDPTCPYCNVAYETLRTNLKTGTQVRWLPVAFLAPKSAGQAAAILGAANAAEAMSLHHTTFKGGGIATAEVTPEMKRRLDSNLALFRDMGFKGVPALVYRTVDGRWDAIKGAPTAADLLKLTVAAP